MGDANHHYCLIAGNKIDHNPALNGCAVTQPFKKMTSALSNFRDIVQLLHRVVRPDALHSRDLHALVDRIHDSLYKGDDCGYGRCGTSPMRMDSFPFSELLRPPTPPTLVIHPEQDVGEIVPNVVVTKEDPEVPEVRNVVVTAPPALIHAVKLDAPTAPKPTPVLAALVSPSSDLAILHDLRRDDEEEDDVSVIESINDDTPTATSDVEEDDAESTVSSEEDEEAEEDEEEAEEEQEQEQEQEEDEDLELKVIKKQRYYWSPSSKRIYEYLEEGYGDCLGTYDGSKIIPLA